MIRITQTYINKTAKEYFENDGWNILYYDLPGGRRSGVGVHAQVNSLWEKIYNLSPDLVIEKNNIVILYEVDNKLTDDYIEKYKKYKDGEVELINKLGEIFKKNLLKLEFGFISIQNYPNIEIDCSFYPFHYLYYDNNKGKLQKTIIKSFEK